MGQIVTTLEHGGKTINIRYDDDNFNPRTEYENLGVIYSNYRSFNPDGKGIDELIKAVGANADRRVTVVPWAAIAKKFLYLKLWIYEHGGIAIKTGERNPFSCPFDSGLGGVIAVTKEAARKAFRVKRLTKKVTELVLSTLETEVQDLEHHINGEVYLFEILDENGEVWDSCGGFLDEDAAIDEAKAVIDNS